MFHSAPPVETPVKCSFYPYDQNGGTALAIAGEDYCLVASDTRHSSGYVVNTRYAPKIHKLTDKTVIAYSGFAGDGNSLVKTMKQRIEWYRHAHDKEMSAQALAQLLGITLYSKRFFPYYVFNMVAGLDENGKGIIYGFDPIGSFEPLKGKAVGSAGSLIQPFLDNQIEHVNQVDSDKTPLSLEKAIGIAKDALTSASEREIYTGDYMEIYIITKDGVNVQKYDMKKD